MCVDPQQRGRDWCFLVLPLTKSCHGEAVWHEEDWIKPWDENLQASFMPSNICLSKLFKLLFLAVHQRYASSSCELTIVSLLSSSTALALHWNVWHVIWFHVCAILGCSPVSCHICSHLFCVKSYFISLLCLLLAASLRRSFGGRGRCGLYNLNSCSEYSVL